MLGPLNNNPLSNQQAPVVQNNELDVDVARAGFYARVASNKTLKDLVNNDRNKGMFSFLGDKNDYAPGLKTQSYLRKLISEHKKEIGGQKLDSEAIAKLIVKALDIKGKAEQAFRLSVLESCKDVDSLRKKNDVVSDKLVDTSGDEDLALRLASYEDPIYTDTLDHVGEYSRSRSVSVSATPVDVQKEPSDLSEHSRSVSELFDDIVLPVEEETNSGEMNEAPKHNRSVSSTSEIFEGNNFTLEDLTRETSEGEETFNHEREATLSGLPDLPEPFGENLPDLPEEDFAELVEELPDLPFNTDNGEEIGFYAHLRIKSDVSDMFGEFKGENEGGETAGGGHVSSESNGSELFDQVPEGGEGENPTHQPQESNVSDIFGFAPHTGEEGEQPEHQPQESNLSDIFGFAPPTGQEGEKPEHQPQESNLSDLFGHPNTDEVPETVELLPLRETRHARNTVQLGVDQEMSELQLEVRSHRRNQIVFG